MINFNCYGRIGDIIYSLWYVKQYCQKLGDKAHIHLQTGVPLPSSTSIDRTHMNSTIFMLKDTAQFIKPFLEKCQFIQQVTISQNKLENSIELDNWRERRINANSGELREYFYNYGTYNLPREFWKPLVEVQANLKYKDKILLTLSERYVNPLVNYKLLEPFKDSLVFIGTEKQYNLFNQNYFKLDERIAPSTLLEVAELMAGAIGFMSNQTGFFAVAEALKVPRILFPAQYMMLNEKLVLGPKNVLPLGGWCQNVSTNEKLNTALIQLLSL